MTNEEIIQQLRKMRAFEREKLDNKLFPIYQKELSDSLKDINKEIVDLTEKSGVAYDKWENIKYSYLVSSNTKENLSFTYRNINHKLNTAVNEKGTLLEIFKASHERTLKLKEFDIETERMILAHMCEVQLICGNKEALPMLES